MKFKPFFWILAALLVVPSLQAEKPSEPWGSAPLIFEPNAGQAPPEVRYLSRGSGYTVLLTDTEAILSFAGSAGAVVRMSVAGGNRKPSIEGLSGQPGVSRYFRGANPKGWQGSVSHYGKVQYRSVYPGIDLTYHGNQHQLEYDFDIAPGMDPSRIALDVSGVDALSIDENGDLLLESGGKTMRQARPVAYQEMEGVHTPVEVSFALHGKRKVGFQVGEYDRSHALVIDPTIVYSTYLGGSALSVGDQGNGIAVDASGNAYVAGYTTSLDFPTVGAFRKTPSGQDGFVLKLNSDGSAILAASYFGGSGSDEAHAVALDGAGNVYVTGYTTSNDFPVVNGFQNSRSGGQDAYLMKFNGNLSAILYSTFLGGTKDDRANGLAVDADGNAFIAGYTISRDFPVRNAFQSKSGTGLGDAFATRIGTDGTLVYSTYLGGFGDDQAYGLAIDSDGNAYLSGYTTSTNFPARNSVFNHYIGGTQDGFLAKLSPNGSTLLAATFWGGTSTDIAIRVAVSPDGSVVTTGYTASFDFPLFAPLQIFNGGDFDIFLTKFNSDLSLVAFSTYLGADGPDSGTALAIGPDGDIYIAGYTGSFQFPVINGLLPTLNGGAALLNRDAFVMRVAADGHAIVLSTYFGGVDNDGAVGIAVDSAGAAYVTGFTDSTSFPVTHPLQAQNAGGLDGFIFKLDSQDIRFDQDFTVKNGGGSVLEIEINSRAQTAFGFVNLERPAGSPPMSGIALVSTKVGDRIESEVALPLGPQIQFGRFFVEATLGVTSLLALVNNSEEPVDIDWFFTDRTGAPTIFNKYQIPAKGQVSAFTNTFPYSIFNTEIGTMTFWASAPVSAVAVRNFKPADLGSQLSLIPIFNPFEVSTATPVIPGIADGAGWQTTFVLVNNGEDTIRGELRFFGQDNSASPGPVGFGFPDGTATSIAYEIPMRTSRTFITNNVNETITTGYAQVVPTDGTNTPGAYAILSNGNLSTSLPAALPGSTFRLYATSSGNYPGVEALSSTTGIILANPADVPVTVQMQITDFDGVAVGSTATVTVPAKGETAKNLYELAGFETLPNPLQGTMRMTVTSGPGIVPVGILRRYSSDLSPLMTTTGPLVDDVAGPLTFPQLITGGSLNTELVLIGSSAGQGSSGVVSVRNQQGDALFVSLRDTAAQPDRPPDVLRSSTTYSVNSRGSAVFTFGGSGGEVVGYSRIEPTSGSAVPAALAVVEELVGVRVISELTLPLEPPTQFGRFYQEVGTNVGSLLSFLNTGTEPADVDFYYTDAAGNPNFFGRIQVPANGEISGFAPQFPFGLLATSSGTVTFNASSPVSVAVFRAELDEATNVRRLTRVPVFNPYILETRALVMPAFGEGKGARTQTVLVNTTENTMRGEIRLYGPGNAPAQGPISATFNGTTASVFRYEIPMRSMVEFKSLGVSPELSHGFMVIQPDAGSNTPGVHSLVSFDRFLTAIDAQPIQTSFRLYVERTGNFDEGQRNSLTTAMALANPADTPVTVRLQLFNQDGTATAMTADVVVPAKGQLAGKLNEFSGFGSLPNSFRGVLKGTVISGAGISAVGMRWRINSTGELIASTNGPIREDTAFTAAPFVIPHIAVGQGFETDIIVLSNSSDQAASGTLKIVDEFGNAVLTFIR